MTRFLQLNMLQCQHHRRLIPLVTSLDRPHEIHDKASVTSGAEDKSIKHGTWCAAGIGLQETQ